MNRSVVSLKSFNVETEVLSTRERRRCAYMKFRGLFLLMLIGLLTLEARAFYDAKQGRWQSRDPIEEEGGVNIIGYIRNDSLNRVDALGLTGTCGPDVSVAVENTLQKIEDVFLTWKGPEQQTACEALYNPSTADGTWDSIELITGVFKGGIRGKGQKCDRTVVYGGQCHYAHAVNYMLFGKMNQLCNRKRKEFANKSYLYKGIYPVTWSLLDVQIAIGVQKYGHYGLGEFDLRKALGGASAASFAFALMGYLDGNDMTALMGMAVPAPALVVLATGIDSASSCKKCCKEEIKEKSLTVRWDPMPRIAPVYK